MNLFDTDQPIVGSVTRVHLLERVLTLAKETKITLLDVGCGTASLWLPLLGHKNIDFWGIDIDRVSIDTAVERFGQEKAFVCNVYDLSKQFASQQFDVAVSTQTLMCLKHLNRALQEINSVLKPNGRLLFTVGWTKYRPNTQFKRQIRGYLDERHYVHRYDEHEIARLLRQTGFEIDHIRFGTIDVLKTIHNKIVDEKNQNKMLQQWKCLEDILTSDEGFTEKGKPYCLGIYFEAIKTGKSL
jgi:ubiquinone/menaquinone biosynthesis C-methylase UbiE